MKKIAILLVLLIGFSFMVSAQGFYFDIGMGLGKPWTIINGEDFGKAMKESSSQISQLGMDFGLKMGYGPIAGTPVYVVGEVSGIGHRIYDSYNYLQFNSILIGPGVLIYPIPLLQLGASFGFSTMANTTDISGLKMYESKGGFGFNATAAVDLGQKNHGVLLGLKYSFAKNTLKESNAEAKESFFGVFVKYAFRHKMH